MQQAFTRILLPFSVLFKPIPVLTTLFILVFAPFGISQDCTYRVVSNTIHCSNQNIEYAIWLNNGQSSFHFRGTASTYIFQECGDDTAEFIASGLTTHESTSEVIDVHLTYSGKTSTTPADSPKSNNCTTIDHSEWIYYTEASGTISTSLHGTYTISRRGPAFQLGWDANQTMPGFGASGWFNLEGGDGFYIRGDINIMLAESTTPEFGEPCTDGRITDGLLALYEFNTGSGDLVEDVSQTGTPLHLTIEDTNNASWIPGGGLRVSSATIIKSDRPADKVTDAIKASGAITMEAWVKPDNITQNGPARITTISKNTGSRNATLGQESDTYVGRLRTTGANTNGMPELASSSNSATVTVQHVVYTRDVSGTEKIYVNGIKVSEDTKTGDCSTWDDDYYLALANELTENRAWLGCLYLVAFYDQALSYSNITQNYEAGVCGRFASGVLPVELTAFNAKLVSEEAILDWQTASELNNDYFTIERSGDGKNWEVLDYIQGAGTTNEVQIYSFTDKQPIRGASYYRLKQVDYNGDFEYSEIRVVNYELEATISLRVYPIPANEILFLESQSSLSETSVQLINALGTPVRLAINRVSDYKISLSLGNLDSGVYYLSIQSEKTQITQKVLVQ